MWNYLYRSDQRLTRKKKLFLNIYSFLLNVVATTSFKRNFDKRDIFLIINFFFRSFDKLSYFILWNYFDYVFSEFYFFDFFDFFFCHCFWHILVNSFSNDFLFIFVVIFEIRKSLRSSFEIKTICFRCLFLFTKLFCLFFRLNNFVAF